MDKKGFVLTLDVILGMIIVFTVISISLFFVSRGSEVSLTEYQPIMIGSDIITLMDEEKSFDSLNHDYIETRMESSLPSNYDMLIRIEGDIESGNGTIEVGGNLPENRLIISGRRVALTDSGTYLKITYFAWTRQQ
ncbi:MAG: hypothetical protein Q8Q35_03860 [Nanoarchaeota archaeon]|nr:hypothetical protein [Nanoarchaeota archaeon]